MGQGQLALVVAGSSRAGHVSLVVFLSIMLSCWTVGGQGGGQDGVAACR